MKDPEKFSLPMPKISFASASILRAELGSLASIQSRMRDTCERRIEILLGDQDDRRSLRALKVCSLHVDGFIEDSGRTRQ